MANFVYIATSLDGYIAKKDGNLDWLTGYPNPEGSDFGYAEFMQGIDAIVMGRKTFETVLTFGDWAYTKPVFILSNTLKSLPERLSGKAEVVNGEIPTVNEMIKARGYHNLYIDGGQTIQAFLNHGLIDELILTRVPILLGEGIPLFGKLTQELRFEHIETSAYPNGLVKSHYNKI